MQTLPQKEDKRMQETYKDLISIVLPTYNRGYIIEEAIKSVIEQTYTNWELIVVDDGSTDNTETLMTKYIDSRIIYIRENLNRGANFCRNLGVRNAKGNFIAFLDSDNRWERNKLECQFTKLYKTDKSVALVFCNEIVWDGSKKIFFPGGTFLDSEIGEILYRRNIVDNNAVLIKKDCFQKAGGFDEEMPRIQDWEFYFRVINVFGYKAIYLSDCLNNNIIQENSISRDDKKMTDAVFHFLAKYYNYYNTKSYFENFFHSVIYSMNIEADYIFKNLYSNFQNEQNKILEISYALLSQLQCQKHTSDLLYEWKLKTTKNMNSIFYNKLDKEGMTVAIYGLGRLAELFYQEIKDFHLRIVYGIDRWKDYFHDLPVKRMTDDLEEVDLMIVTVIDEFAEIREELEKKYKGKIISIESFVRNA